MTRAEYMLLEVFELNQDIGRALQGEFLKLWESKYGVVDDEIFKLLKWSRLE